MGTVDTAADTAGFLWGLAKVWAAVTTAGPVGWIVAGIMLVLFLIGAWIWWRQKRAAAHRETEQGRQRDQGSTPAVVQPVERRQDEAADRIDGATGPSTTKPRVPGDPLA